MGIILFFVLTLAVAGIVVYPLLPARRPSGASSGGRLRPAPGLTNGDIEQAVRRLRLARSENGQLCPACGHAYQASDRFCVRCGGALPQVETQASGSVCPSCGVAEGEGDEFCAKCGQSLKAGEASS